MTAITHTIQRGEIYHFNHRISDNVYRKSLKTDSPRTCREYVSAIMSFIERSKVLGVTMEKNDIDDFIEMLISNKLNEVVRLGKAITEPLSSTAKSYFDAYFAQTDKARYNQFQYDSADWGYAGITPPPRPSFPTYKQWINTRLKSTTLSCGMRDEMSVFNSDEEEMEVSTEHPFYGDFQLPTWHNEYHTHLDNEVNSHTKNLIKATEQNNSLRIRMELNELQQKFAPLLPTTPPPVQQPTIVENAPIFNDVREEYLHHCKTTGFNQINERKRHLNTFAVEIGDVPLNTLTFQDVLVMYHTLLQMPSSNKRDGVVHEFLGLPENERWAAAQDSDIELSEKCFYAADSIKKYRTTLRDFFEWATDIRDPALLSKNPSPKSLISKYLPLPSNRKTRRSNFNDNQAQSIINYCASDLSNPYHWVILLMAYHGVRNSEAVHLDKRDVVIDPETNIVYLYIRKGKTEAAERKIPIHKELLKLGFWEFVQQSKDSLFAFKPYKLSSYYINTIKPTLDLPSTSADGLPLSLYSFRHSVVTKMARMNTGDAQTKYLVGHRDITSNYTHLGTEDLTKFQLTINQITYR